ncbi:hypothetical protein RA210_U190001 [Rubrivivax sp. A210]|nr:hypothetical protein RA210_U190001 [Rubrivivax sp. A210]
MRYCSWRFRVQRSGVATSIAKAVPEQKVFMNQSLDFNAAAVGVVPLPTIATAALAEWSAQRRKGPNLSVGAHSGK